MLRRPAGSSLDTDTRTCVFDDSLSGCALLGGSFHGAEGTSPHGTPARRGLGPPFRCWVGSARPRLAWSGPDALPRTFQLRLTGDATITSPPQRLPASRRRQITATSLSASEQEPTWGLGSAGTAPQRLPRPPTSRFAAAVFMTTLPLRWHCRPRGFA